MQRDRQLIQADARIARRMPRQESQCPVALHQAVDDAAAPIVPHLDFRRVDPDIMAGGHEVAADALHQGRIAVVPVAQKDLHGCRPAIGASRRRLRHGGAERQMGGSLRPEAGVRLRPTAPTTDGSSMLDHIGFGVSDYARSKAFYEQALAPLGIVLLKEMKFSEEDDDGYAGFGRERPQFWIGTGTALTGRLHVALVARDRAAVDAFYQAALAAGGIDNGAPGLRTIYHPNYYGAFVLDPDGHNVEAVCHTPA